MKCFTGIVAISRILFRVRLFSSVSVISLMIQTHLHVNAIRIKTSKLSKGTFRKFGALIWNDWTESYRYIFIKTLPKMLDTCTLVR
jgi:hypothetical protein